MRLKHILFLLITLTTTTISFKINPIKSDLVIASESKIRSTRNVKEQIEYDEIEIPIDQPPQIYSMKIESNVTNRYAKTLVISKVKNEANFPQETVFAVILPEKAFISNFIMAINGKDYQAYVKEKEEAKQIYSDAVAKKQNAAHVAASARDSNRFTVSVNIEAFGKATFYLTYEQLLERKDNVYELVINIHPRQPVKDLYVDVKIEESLPLRMIHAPPIRSGNNLMNSGKDLDPRARIERIGETSARITFKPTVNRQKELAKLMNFNEERGISGQFIVQYDVERSQNGGEVLLEDGYFIHFFAPPELKPLRKNVIFVLDTSGSMDGRKMEQVKTAMLKILDELKPTDKFSLLEFNSDVRPLDLDGSYLTSASVRPSDIVIPENIQKAKEIILKLIAAGGTNIHDALIFALKSVNVQFQGNSNEPQPIIVFLTDGDATVGVTKHSEILEAVTRNNIYKTPIYCLSFGSDARTGLLQKLSLKNNAFSRHIYESADAAIQLHDFYSYISSPVMNNITFKYVSDVKDVTKTNFPILYNGSEIVVTGKIDSFDSLPKITAQTATGSVDYIPEVKKPVAKLERIWAYVTIQQLLEEKEIAENEDEVKAKALDIALKFNFVTPVSSMVVVKPHSTDEIDLEDAGKDEPEEPTQFLSTAIPFASFLQTTTFTTTTMLETTTLPVTTLPTTTWRPEEKITTLQQLKNKIPWLDETLKENNILKTEKNSYKIDVYKRSPEDVICPVTPMGAMGYCKFIHECPKMLKFLTNPHIFEQYHCELEGYAAICCPPNKPFVQ